tara:strand:+ start:253018 stop:253809 length:792 start_codon:yes stop_codon:yes gene_type:complete
VSQNYFESAPDLKAATGAVFSAHKDTGNVNFQAELSGSMSVAKSTSNEMAQMREFADQMQQRAMHNGAETQTSKARELSGFAMGEGLSYGTVALAAAVNPLLGAGVATVAAAKTLNTLRSKMQSNSTFTAPEDFGKGSKADAKSDEPSYKSDGGSMTSFTAVSKNSSVDGGMQAPAFMPSADGDEAEYTTPLHANRSAYDKMYQDMIVNGQSPDDILEMSQKMDEDKNYLAMQRQYDQHAIHRPQNLQMVASSPATPAAPSFG